MEDFLNDHIPKPANKKETYIKESDTYGKHLESKVHLVTINRRLYLGQIEESSILFMPKRDNRGIKEMAIDVAPSIVSLWVVGLSVLYTYPRSVKMFRFMFPNVRSFVAIHIVRAR